MKKYKLIKRPLRLLHTRDKNKYPYIKYKSKNISLKGTNVDEILKILNKLTKKVKRRKLEPTEVKSKKDNIKKYLSGVISSSMSVSSGQVVESRLKEDTEKINELKKENDILKTAVITGNKGINENETTLKAIEQAKEQLAIKFNKLEQENKEIVQLSKLPELRLKKLIEYDNNTKKYILKTKNTYIEGNNIGEIKNKIDKYIVDNEKLKLDLNEQNKLLNEKQIKMELDQQELTTKLKLAEREFKKNELEKQRLEKEKERLSLKNIELEEKERFNEFKDEYNKSVTNTKILNNVKSDYKNLNKEEFGNVEGINRKELLKNIYDKIKDIYQTPDEKKEKIKMEQQQKKQIKELSKEEQIQIKEESQSQQQGEGYIKKFNDGLFTSQIDKIMSPSKYYTYTIANDELDEMINYIKDNKILRGGFIMNTLNTYDKNKVGHWVAVYWDLIDEYELNYYDPYGDSPKNKELIRMFKDLFDDLDIDAYVKVKINKVKQQSISTANCGWFAIKFVLSRFVDIPFKQATNYKKISDSEKDITEIKKHYNKFGFI